jgi:hypothetical protein
MVVQGRHSKQSIFARILYAFPLLLILEITYLHYDRKVFDQKYPTHYRYQQFFAQAQGHGGYATAKHQTASVSHKYLGRKRIVPQKTDAGACERRTVYYQFARIGNEHDV